MAKSTVPQLTKQAGIGKALALYDAACRALADAQTVDEVKDVRDWALGLELYAKQAKNKDLQADAWGLRVKAERGIGRMVKDQANTVGLARGGEHGGRTNLEGVRETPSNARPTLAQAGIDKNLAKRARLAGALSEEEFAGFLEKGRARIADEIDRVSRRLYNAIAIGDISAGPVLAPPLGKYSCIVIDPPWPMEKIERDVAPNQVGFEYPTMTEEDIAEFDVAGLAADDCHLFCWTTQRFLPVTFNIVDGWGFNYICTFVWHKPGGFQPFRLPQYNCEFVLYARLGSPRFVTTKAFPTCFEAPRREHSRKPDEFYDLICRTTRAPRIDVFSREARVGFEQYGNEPERFVGDR